MLQDLEIKFEKTIREYLEKARPFSAYNITKTTRENEKIGLRHQECVGVVHDMDLIQDILDYGFSMTDGTTLTWVRSTFTNWNGPAFEVYHPLGYDLKNFVPEGVGPAQQFEIDASVRPMSMIGQVTPQTDGSQPDAGGHNSDGTYRTDFRNRLMVPTKYLRDAGMHPGDSVHVFGDAQSEIIWITKDVKAMTNCMQGITIQTVERNGDLRLSGRTLKLAELTKKKFVIESTEKDYYGNKIKVVEIKEAG